MTSPVPAEAPLIRFEQVSFSYDHGTAGPAFSLRDIDLTLRPGELVALIGQNGSGKTTLARLCNGLLRPTAGRVLVGGQDTREREVAELARNVGYVFQNPDHQLFAPTVAEDVAFGPRNFGLPPDDVERRVRTVLSELDLSALAERHPLVLSYGARRLVALAGVLVLGSPTLVLDEPTAGLDREHQDRLFRVIHQRRDDGSGVLLISHDFALVAVHASRVIVMANGAILGEGSPRAILTDASLLATAGLAPTPITRLAQLLARHGIPEDVLTEPELAAAYARRYREMHGR
jgi:energy-coupling factor transport system ATP-binding protein